MKNNIFALILALGTAFTAAAQTSSAGYFVDGFLYRHEINAAAGNEKNYVAMPGLGNLNVDMRGNLSLTDVLYNVNGRTTTFLNPDVSAEEVLGNLADKNRLNVNVRVNVLSGGFKAFGGYNTITLSARANVSATLPKELFRLYKEGVKNGTYDIGGVNAHADAYTELAFNHSRNISENVRIGGTLKLLVGAGNSDSELKKAQLVLGEDAWTVVSNARMQSNIGKFVYETDIDEDTGREYVSGIDIDKPSVSGVGAAIDLGVMANVGDFELSAAVNDLGFIRWSNNVVASTNGDRSFELSKYAFNVSDDATNNFDDELDKVVNDLADLYEMSDMGDIGPRTTTLATTVNLGAKYTLPCYRAMSFGLLNTTRIHNPYTWTEFRLSANYAPCRIVSMGISGAYGTNGGALGWLVNLKAKAFNMFLGMDYAFVRIAKQGVPLQSNASANVGINFVF